MQFIGPQGQQRWLTNKGYSIQSSDIVTRSLYEMTNWQLSMRAHFVGIQLQGLTCYCWQLIIGQMSQVKIGLVFDRLGLAIGLKMQKRVLFFGVGRVIAPTCQSFKGRWNNNNGHKVIQSQRSPSFYLIIRMLRKSSSYMFLHKGCPFQIHNHSWPILPTEEKTWAILITRPGPFHCSDYVNVIYMTVYIVIILTHKVAWQHTSVKVN